MNAPFLGRTIVVWVVLPILFMATGADDDVPTPEDEYAAAALLESLIPHGRAEPVLEAIAASDDPRVRRPATLALARLRARATHLGSFAVSLSISAPSAVR